MISARTRAVLGLDLKESARRPIFWMLAIVVVLMAFGLASGGASIQTGDSSTGGKKAWITSQFAVAQGFSLTGLLLYSFFVAVAAGMAVVRDDETKIGELLHTTPLRPREYIWGKFAAVLLSVFAVVGVHATAAALFNQLLPRADAAEVHGPFAIAHYLVPVLAFTAPLIIFLAGVTFAVGERTRKPVVVYLMPVALLLLSIFPLLTWSPTWLDPNVNRLLMALEPSGFRWLNETYLRVDRGVDFYNVQSIPFDALFVASRAAFVAIGLLAVAWSASGFTRSLRGARVAPADVARALSAAPRTESHAAAPRTLASLGMTQRAPSWLGVFGAVARAEMRELRAQAGLYLFIPLILFQVIENAAYAVGAFDTPLLQTSGTIAAGAMNSATLLVAMLLTFYTVESLQREASTGLAALYRCAPTRTSALLAGKVAASAAIGVVVLLTTFAGCAAVLLYHHTAPLRLGPFFIVFGGLVTPTLILWASFITFLYCATRNRYATYALGLGALVLSGCAQVYGWNTWATNWALWSAFRWSDFGPFELSGEALAWNRAGALALSALFVVLSVRLYPRRETDFLQIGKRLRPARICMDTIRLSPYAAPAVACIAFLAMNVHNGFQGSPVEKATKDYWRKNMQTWRDAKDPAIEAVTLDLELLPALHDLHSKGTLRLVNDQKEAMHALAFTGGPHWRNVRWTLDGAEAHPENRSMLYVMPLPAAMAPGEKHEVGFEFDGRLPDGMSANGSGMSEFVMPSSVVLTSFNPTFVPLVGYSEEIGVDEKNRTDSKEYPDDYYLGTNPPAFGSPTPFTTHVRVTAPEEFTLNSVGRCTSDVVRDGKRTTTWESDHPVRFFNVAAGKWAVRRGDGTRVFYLPEHAYNIEEIGLAIDSARKYYAEWFHDYPWSELKLSEFAGHASYAQGFATNITFSESIGFLTENDPKTHLAFLVTAHETAHQWWGNLVTPAKGPGANLLSEAMAHYSTMRLLETVKGEHARREFCKRIEERYNDQRQVDSERPLVRIDGTRPGDTTCTYDKGGWVFWMMEQRLGRDAMQKGLRAFIEKYANGPDYPVLQNLTEDLRASAQDAAEYDRFVDAWFRHVVVPEYQLSDAERHAEAAKGAAVDAVLGAGAAASAPGGFRTTFKLKNVGTGAEAVTVAACCGEPFDADGKPNPLYKDSRITVQLRDQEAATLQIRCDFEPDRIVVDPDVRQLQIRRNKALQKF